MLCDVGTDHGYLPISLLLDGKIEYAVAADIRRSPLESARRHALEAGCGDKMRFELCDGLDFAGAVECDTVVCAGMGGETIAAILDAVPWSREKGLLLQPMSRAEYLRPWLADHGYAVLGETLVEDKGHLYPVLQATGGEMRPLAPGQQYYGFSQPDSPLFAGYLREWRQRLQRAVEGLRQAQVPGDRLCALEGDLAALMEKERTI